MRLGRLLVGPKVLGAAGELLLNCRAALKAGDQTLAYHGAVVGGEAASSGSSGLPPVGKPQGSLCACLEARSSVKQGMCGSRLPPEPYTKLSSPRIGGVGKYVMVASEGGGSVHGPSVPERFGLGCLLRRAMSSLACRCEGTALTVLSPCQHPR